MADRSVSVKLIANIADYERGMAQATAVTRRFEAQIERLRRAARRDLGRVGDGADDVSEDLAEMQAALAAAAARIDELGDEARTSAAELALLRRELDRVDRASRGLGGAGARGARGAADAAGGFLGALPSELKGALIAGGVAAGAAFAPMIGAMIAGAVVGGIGLGGIAGGIAAAAQDPKVKAAGSRFAAEAQGIFADLGRPFVAPTVTALDLLQRELKSLDLPDLFAPLASHVDELARGLAGLVSGVMPGLRRAFADAGPAIDMIARELPNIGAAFGDMIADITGSDGAMQGLDLTLKVISFSLTATGKIIGGLSNAFHFLGDAAAAVSGALEDMPLPPILDFLMQPKAVNDFWENLGKNVTVAQYEIRNGSLVLIQSAEDVAAAHRAVAADAVTSAMAAAEVSYENAKLTASFRNAAGEVQGLIRAYDILNGKALSQREAIRAAEAALDTFQAAIKDSGGSLSVHSEKGRAAAESMDRLARAAVNGAQAVLDNNGTVEQARGVYDHYIGTLRNTLSQAGFTRRQIDDLVRSIARMPTSKSTTISAPGAGGAKASVDALVRSINNIPRFTTSEVQTVFTRVGTATASAYATGTPSAPPGLAWVGERGPELMSFVGGEKVYPHGKSMSIARGYAGGTGGTGGGGGGGGYGPQVLDIRLSGASGVVEHAVVEVLRSSTITLGGGSVQRSYGRTR